MITTASGSTAGHLQPDVLGQQRHQRGHVAGLSVYERAA
jgi:hypothetical protein